MQRKKGRGYSDVLGKPSKQVDPKSIPNRELLGRYASEKELHAARDAWDEGMLLLLLDHFKITRDDSNRWRALALALAKTHVPLFQDPPPKGRPKKWNRERDAVAKICIDRLIEKHRWLSVKSAATKVAAQADWKKFLGGKSPSEQIRQAYFRATPDDVSWVLSIAEKVESLPPGTTGIYAFLVSDVVRIVSSEFEQLGQMRLPRGTIGA